MGGGGRGHQAVLMNTPPRKSLVSLAKAADKHRGRLAKAASSWYWAARCASIRLSCMPKIPLVSSPPPPICRKTERAFAFHARHGFDSRSAHPQPPPPPPTPSMPTPGDVTAFSKKNIICFDVVSTSTLVIGCILIPYFMGCPGDIVASNTAAINWAPIFPVGP